MVFSFYTVNLYQDETGQPGGVYLYRVTNESGSLLGSGKVVIEK